MTISLSGFDADATVTYHVLESCNACGGVNSVAVKDTINHHVCEAETKCWDCGHEDYWAYGFFESGQHLESKCDKY